MRKIFVYGERVARRNYEEAVAFCGGVCIISQNLEYAKLCDGLLLSGGGDIDPKRYGAKNLGSTNIDETTDAQELELVRAFSVTNRPILGICRGLQVVNVAFGGDLIQDIKTASTHQWTERTGDQVHPVTAEEGSFLQTLYGNGFRVNSAHHQAVGKLAQGLAVSAKAKDGVIEAIECKAKRIYAVQFHPERMSFHHRRPDTVDGRFLFEWFLNLC